MARDGTSSTRVADRYTEGAQQRINPAFPVYEGYVIDTEDFSYTGRVRVRIPALESAQTNNSEIPEEAKPNGILVRYMSPFFGHTNINNMAPNQSAGFNCTTATRSYGLFTGPPPDENANVVILFPRGNIHDGIIIGSVVEVNSNFSVPAPSTSMVVDQNSPSGASVGLGAERNKRDVEGVTSENTEIRPPHSQNGVLQEQGLAEDGVRGHGTHSSTREAPTRTVGLLTPGQHAIVFDDGAHPEGADRRVTGQTGVDPMIRMRSANGGQVLLHDGAGVIYMITPSGRTWVEMSNNGKIDIYGADDISLHSSANLNLVADGAVNIEGASVAIRAREGDIQAWAQGGKLELKSKDDMNLTTDANGNLFVTGHLKIKGTRVDMNGPVPSKACEPNVQQLTDSNRFYRASIASRVPEPEPWGGHEIQKFPVVTGFSASSTNPRTVNPNQAIAAPALVPSDVRPSGQTSSEQVGNNADDNILASTLSSVVNRAVTAIGQLPLSTRIADTLASVTDYLPIVDVRGNRAVAGYSQNIEELGNALGRSNSNRPVDSSQGGIREILSNAGKAVGNAFAPIGSSIDNILDNIDRGIFIGQSTLDNVFGTAQQGINTGIGRINRSAARNLPAGITFGITQEEAYSAYHTSMWRNRNSVVNTWGAETQVPQRVFDSFVIADRVYGDSRYWLTPSGATIDIKPLVDNKKWDSIAEYIKLDPRSRNINKKMYNIVRYEQYPTLDPARSQRAGFQEILKRYSKLTKEQKDMVDLQYYIAYGRFHKNFAEQRQREIRAMYADREKLLPNGLNLVSQLPEGDITTITLPGQTIIDSILDKTTTVGFNVFPSGYLFAVAGVLSDFDTDYEDTTTGAAGLYQFTEDQWNSIVNTYDSDGTAWGLVPVTSVDQRVDIEAATIGAALITRINRDLLEETLSRAPSQDELFLAHRYGIVTAKLIVSADTNANLEDIGLPADFITANSSLTKDQFDFTVIVGDFKQNVRNMIVKKSYAFQTKYGN